MSLALGQPPPIPGTIVTARYGVGALWGWFSPKGLREPNLFKNRNFILGTVVRKCLATPDDNSLMCQKPFSANIMEHALYIFVLLEPINQFECFGRVVFGQHGRAHADIFLLR
jgi:hypothetical protein